jgi:hypothetical protein
MPADTKLPTDVHAHAQASGAWVYGVFPADFTYRISAGNITAYGATTDERRKGEFEDELERLGFPHVAAAWGSSGTELTTRIYERHPTQADASLNASVIPERILIVVELNCVERYYLALDLHDALPFLEHLATTSAAMAQSVAALHRREERLRREALVAGLAGPLERIARALRVYVETEMLDDILARDDAPPAEEPPAAEESELLAPAALPEPESADDSETMLTDLLRRRARQRKNNTND